MDNVLSVRTATTDMSSIQNSELDDEVQLHAEFKRRYVYFLSRRQSETKCMSSSRSAQSILKTSPTHPPVFFCCMLPQSDNFSVRPYTYYIVKLTLATNPGYYKITRDDTQQHSLAANMYSVDCRPGCAISHFSPICPSSDPQSTPLVRLESTLD